MIEFGAKTNVPGPAYTLYTKWPASVMATENWCRETSMAEEDLNLFGQVYVQRMCDLDSQIWPSVCCHSTRDAANLPSTTYMSRVSMDDLLPEPM